MSRAPRVPRSGNGSRAARPSAAPRRSARWRACCPDHTFQGWSSQGCPRCPPAARCHGSATETLSLIFKTRREGSSRVMLDLAGVDGWEGERSVVSLCAFSSSVSVESSVAEAHDEMLQVLKEKTRLEGQLEALSLEASQVTSGGGASGPRASCSPGTGSRVSKREPQQPPCLGPRCASA